MFTGAFLPDPTTGVSEQIHVLITTPKAAATPACTGALAAFGKCAPMMIFRHGLVGGRADMLTVADSYAAAGMVTVAIDAAKHGDRAFCTPGVARPVHRRRHLHHEPTERRARRRQPARHVHDELRRLAGQPGVPRQPGVV